MKEHETIRFYCTDNELQFIKLLVVFDDIRTSNEIERGMRKGEGERVYLR